MSVILNVSRNTVDTAYYQLMSEGYIDSVPKSGFYVNDISLAHHTSDENSDNTENSASNTKYGLPQRSMAQSASVSSIGNRKLP